MKDRSTIWAEEAGPENGTLVALVHGSMDRSTGMLKLSRQLDRTCRVLRYDRRGYGRSIPHDGPFGIDQQVCDLVALLDGRPTVLIGHSYGGDVALATASRHPGLVSGVAVYEAPLSWLPWWPSHTAGGFASANAADPVSAAEGFMRRMIGEARWEGLPERTRATRRLEGAAMVGELVDLRAHAAWEADRIRVPVVAGHGTKASAHQVRGTTEVAASVADGELVVLDGCGHDAPLSHAMLFADLIVRPLLRRVAASSTEA